MRRAVSFVLAIVVVLAAGSCLRPAGVRYPELPTWQAGALHIINFDVGQGDALLFIHGGKTMLVDAGAPMNNRRRTERQLPRRFDALIGSRHLDYFVNCHFHQDHIGGPGGVPNRKEPIGLYALIEREGFTIDTMVDRGFWYIGQQGATQRHYEAYSKRWIDSGVARRRRVVQIGDTLDMGEGVRVEVVSASGNGLLGRLESLFPSFVGEAPPSENDYSVGLKITMGDFEMFTAGDLSGRNVVRQYGPVKQSYTDVESRVTGVVGPVEVYRVNHHGSRHSTNPCFAQTLHPMVSVFSTGYNRYGHPDPDVYARLKQYGDVFITGGVDPKHEKVVDPADIVGDDVEIVVEPSGGRFWVNGKAYESLSDAEELARPLGGESQCPDHAEEGPAPDDYELEVDPGTYED